MTFTLTIQCDNAAFHDHNDSIEVARILREVATQLEPCDLPVAPVKIRDLNGNTVGSYVCTD